MKVGLAVTQGRHAGGIERYASDLAEDLRARGHEAVLLADGAIEPDYARAFDAARPLSRAHGLDVVFAQKAGLVSMLPANVGLLVAAHDHDDTCVRSHRYLPIGHRPCHETPGLGCVAQGCVVVRTRDRLVPISLKNPFELRRSALGIARRASYVACSAYVAQRLVETGVDEGRVHVVHPVPRENDLPLSERPAECRLLVVAQLVRGKGVDVAIDALRFLPAATLTVAGDGPQRGELEAQARKVAPGRVTFLGRVHPTSVCGLYDEASVVLVPSRWPEPFGMVGLEAMGRGRPVVGSDHGGIPEWLDRDAGIRAPVGDAAAFAQAARRLHDDREAGERARSSLARFSRATTLARLELLLESAC